MNFLDVIERCVLVLAHRTAAKMWWGELASSPRGRVWMASIEADAVFEKAHEVNDVPEFARKLYEYASETDPLRRGKLAIEDCGKMILCGPSATLAGDHLARVVAVDVAHARLALRRVSIEDELGYRIWARRVCASPPQENLNSSAQIRGHLPTAFWAFEEDVRTVSPFSVSKVRAFLGLDPYEPPEFEHFLFLLPTVAPTSAKAAVPSGWDAYDNSNFQPAKLPCQTGHTKDLSSGLTGAREVVTRPVPVGEIRTLELISVS